MLHYISFNGHVYRLTGQSSSILSLQFDRVVVRVIQTYSCWLFYFKIYNICGLIFENEIKENLQPPDFAWICSFSSPKPFFLVQQLYFMVFSMMKVFSTLNSPKFLAMNHEKAIQIIDICIWMTAVLITILKESVDIQSLFLELIVLVGI